MRYLSWIVSLPLTLLFLIFVLSNRETVELSLWPFATTIAAPLYLFFMATVILSFMAGAVIMWFGQHKHRAAAKHWRREAEAAQAALAAPPKASDAKALAPTDAYL
ncbi:MAG: lipopolysaccharide assembly protein LapA domain-containing protein [Bdellovibrionales bacterium]